MMRIHKSQLLKITIMKKQLLLCLVIFWWSSLSFAQTPSTHLHFDGTNDPVTLTVGIGNSLSNGTEITIEYWFKGTRLNTGLYISDGISYIITGWGFGANRLFFNSNDGESQGVDCGPLATIENNTWHHLAFVRKKNTIFANYLDGVLQSSRVAGGNNLPSFSVLNMYIGRNAGATSYLNGNIDEVRIWNVALSGEDIARRKSCELAGNEAGLLAYYKFNQGVDAGNNSALTALTDASSHNYNGTLSNFALSCTTSYWLSGSPIITGATISAAPTTTTSQVYVGAGTIANLTATGTNLKWYSDATTGSALATSTALVDDSTYYVSQTAICGESARIPVTVYKISEATQTICNQATVTNLVSTPSSGVSAKWFTSASGGSAMASNDPISTGI
jgi:hypothetical protein